MQITSCIAAGKQIGMAGQYDNIKNRPVFDPFSFSSSQIRLNINMKPQTELKLVLRQLINKKCWECAASPITGSEFSLHFGKKVPFQMPANLPKDIESEGEFILFIRTAAWRLDRQAGVVCSSQDSPQNDGPMLKGLHQIVGRKIRSIKLLNFACDLQVNLSGGLVLRIFCNQTSVGEYSSNYSVHAPTKVYGVEGSGKIKYSDRSNQPKK